MVNEGQIFEGLARGMGLIRPECAQHDGTKREALERYLSEAMSDLCDTCRPNEVGNRITSAQTNISRVRQLLSDVLAIEREAGIEEAKKTGIAEAKLHPQAPASTRVVVRAR